MTKKKQIVTHLVEFFFVGLVMGVIEDMLAIHFATDAKITLETLKVALVVAIPFAVVSELIVDVQFFRQAMKSFLYKKS